LYLTLKFVCFLTIKANQTTDLIFDFIICNEVVAQPFVVILLAHALLLDEVAGNQEWAGLEHVGQKEIAEVGEFGPEIKVK
jgi:hypothetical protein